MADDAHRQRSMFRLLRKCECLRLSPPCKSGLLTLEILFLQLPADELINILMISKASYPSILIAALQEAKGEALDVKAVYLMVSEPCFLNGLRLAIESDPRLIVCGSSLDSQNGMAEAIRLQAHLVICDSVEKLLLRPSTEFGIHRLKVIVFGSSDFASQAEWRHAGVSGFLLRTSTPENIRSAIHTVLDGHIVIDQSQTEFERSFGSNDRIAELAAEISSRETSVLRLSAYGHSCKEIARELKLSPKSVETYKARALQKLGLEGRVDIIRFASRRGWFNALH